MERARRLDGLKGVYIMYNMYIDDWNRRFPTQRSASGG
jgi:hypothetical protein